MIAANRDGPRPSSLTEKLKVRSEHGRGAPPVPAIQHRGKANSIEASERGLVLAKQVLR